MEENQNISYNTENAASDNDNNRMQEIVYLLHTIELQTVAVG